MSNPMKNKAWNAPKPVGEMKISAALRDAIAAYFWIKDKQNQSFKNSAQKEEYCQPICDAARAEGKRATILPGYIIITSKTRKRIFNDRNKTGVGATDWKYRDHNETETKVRLAHERHARRERARNRRAVKLLMGEGI